MSPRESNPVLIRLMLAFKINMRCVYSLLLLVLFKLICRKTQSLRSTTAHWTPWGIPPIMQHLVSLSQVWDCYHCSFTYNN